MNGVVRSLRRRDQVSRVEDVLDTVNDVVNRHRVHVVNHDVGENLVPGHTQVTTVVSGYNCRSDLLPLTGSIKPLVDVSIETKSGGTN